MTVIENPILNSAFAEPSRHFRFDDDGITNEVVDERRPSSYFVPIPATKRRGGQQAFDTEWTQDRVEENEFINRVRDKVAIWRQGGHRHVTPTTRRLLEHWTDPDRGRRLFFCQIEALETAIYLVEAAGKVGDQWIANDLRDKNTDANPGLFRVAHKMATGTGKTVVMGMLIAWHTLNKAANPQDSRFADSFLVVTPGITIRDRLRVLLPSDPGNYYAEMNLVPDELVDQLGRAQIVITNFHAFQRRESAQGKAAKLTKTVLTGGGPNPFLETPAQMVNRVCRPLGSNKNVVVLNDEAHHCYRRRATEGETEDGAKQPKLTGDDRKEAEERERHARVWVTGLEAVEAKLGIKCVYDLSATPFFLKGSGYSEGTLFPWVVSDFSLIDAIESGVVKIPRVPVSDDSLSGQGIAYRDLWVRIREHLPKSHKPAEGELPVEPRLPTELQGALHSLYGNYVKAHEQWATFENTHHAGTTPPVFIVVCNNTTVSKLVFDYVAGWEQHRPDGTTVIRPGGLDLFSNERDGRWAQRPTTILVDSRQLESGEAMSAEFKKLAATEIDEFKTEYRTRFPGRDADQLTDEDLLREVMNTVGKPGKLGDHIKCVVSVSMLTEGWDANTVTHVLGVRAFGTQLLCEQVVGRGLRRRSYVVNDQGHFEPEYAEVYGVPFSFIPAAGSTTDPKPGPNPTRVRALEDRVACELTFPRVIGYRHEFGGDRVTATFTDDAKLSISTQDVPTKVESAGVVGEVEIHTLDDLRDRREQDVAFHLTERLLAAHFRDEHGFEEPWLFPQLLGITRRWMDEYVTTKGSAFIQLLLLHRMADDAVERIYQAVVRDGTEDRTRLYPVLRQGDPLGTTRGIDFDTTKPVYVTSADKCHVSHVVADSGWEEKMAQVLEDMPEVTAYVKNQGLDLKIPYTIDGEQRSYLPDFLVSVDDPHSPGEPLQLLVEVSGAQRRDKTAKVATTRNLWVPAVNAHGAFGRWDYVEVTDPWDAEATIRSVWQGSVATAGSGG